MHLCDECDYTNVIEENLLNHKIANHSKHSCDKCNHMSDSIAELIRHSIELHTNSNSEVKFHCRVCNSAFTSKDLLQAHIKIHRKPDNILVIIVELK